MKTIIGVIIVILLIIGEIRGIYKALTCNWEPVGKAEIVTQKLKTQKFQSM